MEASEENKGPLDCVCLGELGEGGQGGAFVPARLGKVNLA